MEQMLDQMNLTETEKAAALEAIQKKQNAQQELRTALTNLSQVANNPNATDAQDKGAIETYLTARDKVAKQMAETDKELVKKLSPHAQVRLLAVGILENGLSRPGMMGPRGMGPGPGPGPGRRGEGRMGRRGGPTDIRGGTDTTPK